MSDTVKGFLGGVVVGLFAAIALDIWLELTPKDTWQHWRHCQDDRASYIADSAFYRLRPGCKVWNPEHGEWTTQEKSR